MEEHDTTKIVEIETENVEPIEVILKILERNIDSDILMTYNLSYFQDDLSGNPCPTEMNPSGPAVDTDADGGETDGDGGETEADGGGTDDAEGGETDADPLALDSAETDTEAMPPPPPPPGTTVESSGGAQSDSESVIMSIPSDTDTDVNRLNTNSKEISIRCYVQRPNMKFVKEHFKYIPSTHFHTFIGNCAVILEDQLVSLSFFFLFLFNNAKSLNWYLIKQSFHRTRKIQASESMVTSICFKFDMLKEY